MAAGGVSTPRLVATAGPELAELTWNNPGSEHLVYVLRRSSREVLYVTSVDDSVVPGQAVIGAWQGYMTRERRIRPQATDADLLADVMADVPDAVVRR